MPPETVKRGALRELLHPGEGRDPVPSQTWTPACAGEQCALVHITRSIISETMDKPGCVYILASRRNGTLYIGVTSDLPSRIYEHRIGAVRGFTRRYGCKILV